LIVLKRDITDTISKIFSASEYNSSDVLILLTVPLDENHFKKWNKLSSTFTHTFFNYGDFDDNGYYTKVVVPVLHFCKKMKSETNVKIEINVTFDKFKALLSTLKYRVVFLVAHHETNGQIQFADNKYEYSDIKKFLLLQDIKKMNLLHIICNTKNEFESIYKTHEGIELYGYTLFEIPIEEAFLYMYHLTKNLEHGTFSEAHGKAIKEIKQLFTNG